jgi:Leu/Phe-tRNA-protein transferase
MHLERAVVFFNQMHESRTVRRLIPRYELRYDAGSYDAGSYDAGPGAGDFERILERCARVHGDDWLTPPLRESFLALRKLRRSSPRMVSFGLYRENRLVAGEFGVVAGRVYTSYSGYYDENSAGSVQLAMTGRYLRDAGFAFWDLGMPLPYKKSLGAQIIDRENFFELFRQALIC